VLTQMRRTLQRRGGMTTQEASEFGTHSCRVGGASALFQLGAARARGFQALGRMVLGRVKTVRPSAAIGPDEAHQVDVRDPNRTLA
jgi:hypothetical protein